MDNKYIYSVNGSFIVLKDFYKPKTSKKEKKSRKKKIYTGTEDFEETS